jgi:hypothetical protein
MSSTLHYYIDGIHHLQVINLKDNILTVFDLGMTECFKICNCHVGKDHNNIRYQLYRLEILPKLQLAIAGWPLIGKVIKTFSWNEIKTKLIDDFDFN